ncbi:YfcE family phosphodiesterase [Candidatus Nanosalina sp. VS9-1]|uniref:YfcE family phosphodiesterase n=1 Tax=Candidatus Nanosalina sp. VS9-1 TaxID=3388566 RepID=UPI0039DFDA9E
MIAIISDSHIPKRAEKIPEEFHEKLEQASKTVHCGDFETQEKYEKLKEKYDVIGVKGNCDFFDLEASQKFSVNGVKFGAYHGAGITPRGHHPTLVQTAETLDVDVLFHGHTHQQEIAEHEGKILLNPGSCTGVGGGSSREKNPSMMTVKASEKGLEVKIFEKDRKSGEIEVSEETVIDLN